MRVPRVYLDTSVLGGCFDREFAVWSRALMDDFRAGRFRPLLSALVAAELEQAPPDVRVLYTELLGLAERPLVLGREVFELADRYAAHRIREFNAVNLEAGYKALAIHSPREVTTYETEDQ